MKRILSLTAVGACLVACGGDASTDKSTSGSGASGGSPSGSGATGGESAGGAATAGSSAGGSASGGSSSGGAGGSADCNPPCNGGLECCNGLCVNKGNDIKNCGSCGTTCEGPNPFCDNGTCGMPPCDPGTTCNGTASCCGSECCMPGMLCCVVPAGPVGPPTCTPPTNNGTCEPGCPECVCASPDTPIATPEGDRRIADLAVGDLVYSVDRGAVVVVPIARVNRVAVDRHRVVRATLEGGAVVEISPRHPTADGRTFADLRAGDSLHGVAVSSAVVVPYEHSHTHDILPSSDSGAYFVGGALVGSTLADAPVTVPQGCFSPPAR